MLSKFEELIFKDLVKRIEALEQKVADLEEQVQDQQHSTAILIGALQLRAEEMTKKGSTRFQNGNRYV